MISKRRVIMAAGGAAVLGAVAAGGIFLAHGGAHVTSAQTPGTSPSATATPNPQRAARQAAIDDFLNQLAQNLHIDRTTLDNALKQTAKDEVAKAVQQGKLTQAEANQIDQMIDSGQFPKGFGIGIPGIIGARVGFAQVPGLRDALNNAFQQTVGETPQQFMQEVRSGKTPDQVFQEHNTSAQAVRQAEVNAAKPILDQAVQNGTITQQQEDAFLQRLQNGPAFGVPGWKGGHGPHGPRGRGGAGPNATATPSASGGTQ